MDNFRYIKPSTLEDAISRKSKYCSKAKFLLGGTDLFIAMDKGVVTPKTVIDLKGIESLKYLEERDGAVFIGAAVTWTEILESELIKKVVPGLWEAADLVASVGVRNTATLVGNLCNAVPSLEGGAPLYVRDAVVLLEGKDGKREVSIKEFFTGVKKTLLRDDELMTGVKIPVEKKSGEVYIKMGRYEGEDLAQAGVSVFADQDNNYRIALSAVAVTPVRAVKAEEFLKGKKLNPDLAAEAAELALEAISPISDLRSSKEYRIHMCRIMVKRGLIASVSRMETGVPALSTRLI
ncbi:MAG: xanthine dehydrogenase family protein subunit M [Spirochaetales bacterium]|nr:xanthine dehydrogenase family protein subunit M [Spirochaetales bacterium]